MRDKILSVNDLHYHIAERDNKTIDTIGIAKALYSCYEEVLNMLNISNDLIIIDGNMRFDELISQGFDIQSIVKADTKIPTVMAASILGKTYRDEKIKLLDKLYPRYDFKKNKGYGSADHMYAIQKHGPCELHRMSYAPMKDMKNGLSH